MRRTLVRYALAMLASMAVGYALLVVAYALPTEPMRAHLAQELGALEDRWGMQPFVTDNGAAIDIATDYHMLAIAAYDTTESPVVEALQARYNLPDGYENGYDQLGILRSTLDTAHDHEAVPYTRYWHGYLVPLKLELLLGDYYSVLVANGIVLLALLLCLFLLMERHGLGRAMPALFVTVALASPASVGMCLQYYACAYVTLLSLIALVALRPQMREAGWGGVFFLCVGMATSYLDFLTTPVVTLGLPLAMAILADARDGSLSWRHTATEALSWALGYAVMWASKWVIASLVLHTDAFAPALIQVQTRTSNSYGTDPTSLTRSLSYGEVLLQCMANTFGRLFAKTLVVLGALCSCAQLLRGRSGAHLGHATRKGVAMLACVAALPFAWIAVLTNHTYMHAYFTHRMLVVAVFALLCMPLAPLLVGRRTQRGRHERDVTA